MKSMTGQLERAGQTSGGKRARRSWSEEEKRRLVEEALAPGASVAEVARRHGVNANLLFNWRRLARETAPVERAVAEKVAAGSAPLIAGPCEFMPIGVFAEAERSAVATPRGSSSSTPAAPSTRRTALADKRGTGRAGLIGIELSDGTRLQVDAAVDEGALGRVLAVLRAAS